MTGDINKADPVRVDQHGHRRYESAGDRARQDAAKAHIESIAPGLVLMTNGADLAPFDWWIFDANNVDDPIAIVEFKCRMRFGKYTIMDFKKENHANVMLSEIKATELRREQRYKYPRCRVFVVWQFREGLWFADLRYVLSCPIGLNGNSARGKDDPGGLEMCHKMKTGLLTRITELESEVLNG